MLTGGYPQSSAPQMREKRASQARGTGLAADLGAVPSVALAPPTPPLAGQAMRDIAPTDAALPAQGCLVGVAGLCAGTGFC